MKYKALFALGAVFLANVCVADSPIPYQLQVQIPREAATIPFDDAAKKVLSLIYESSIEACAPNPGASYFIVVTDAEATNASDNLKASAELALTKEQIAKLGFDERMIFSEVIQFKGEGQRISPNIIVELSCRRKAAK
ncbi:hypothetical protein [Variovorax atrisoli]|uniref:hypothetical protein n=1 Tax=Variovorax atrisoli TaxID=3394203 RepID=UPI0011A5FD23|nr:hypothetical protein [Variovorax paradoxus]MDR6518869.1 hypothetical protein [Variovorax paradoxus]